MSSNLNSLAIEEVKEHCEDQKDSVHFEPHLTVLVNQRYIKNSCHEVKPETVYIKGRITISF